MCPALEKFRTPVGESAGLTLSPSQLCDQGQAASPLCLSCSNSKERGLAPIISRSLEKGGLGKLQQ